jgi:hypothetical protein
MKGEIWKDVLGYEGYYKASNLGRVKSMDRLLNNKLGVKNVPRKGRVLSPGGNIYLVVTLAIDGVIKYASVHRIVFEAFNGRTNLQIDHINNNTKDNRLSNLQALSSHDNNIKAKSRKFKTSRFPGVHKYPNGSWRAQIGIKGKKIALGYFQNEEDAYAAYMKMKPI